MRLLDFIKIVRIAKIIRTSGHISSLKSEGEKKKNKVIKKVSHVKNRKRRHNLTINQKNNLDKLVELGIKYRKETLEKKNTITTEFDKSNERKVSDCVEIRLEKRVLSENESEEENDYEKDAVMNTEKIKILSNRGAKRSTIAFANKSNFDSLKQARTSKECDNLKIREKLALKDNSNEDSYSTRKKSYVRKSSLVFRKFAVKRTSKIGLATNKFLAQDMKLRLSQIYKDKENNNHDEDSDSKSASLIFSEDNMNEKEEQQMEQKIEYLKQINCLHMKKVSLTENLTVEKENKLKLIKKDTIPALNQHDTLRSVSGETNSKIEKILMDIKTEQVVIVIMLLLVTIPIFDFDFLEQIIYTSDMIPNRHVFCLGLIYLQMNYTFYNLTTYSLNELNSTISDCFYANQYQTEVNNETTFSSPGLEPFLSINFNQSDLFWKLSNLTGFMKGNSMIAIDKYDDYIANHRDTYDFSIETYSIDGNNSINFSYELTKETEVTEILTVGKSLYVLFFLVIGVYTAGHLIKTIIITPLDIIFSKLSMNLKCVETNKNTHEDELSTVDYMFRINDMFDSKFFSEDVSNEPVSKEDKILQSCYETKFINDSLNNMLDLISMSIGSLAFPIIPNSNLNIKEIELNLTRTPVISFEGVGLFLSIVNTDMLFINYQNRSHSILSEIYTIFHSIGIIFSGEPYHKSQINAIFWKKNKEKWLNDTNTYLKQLVTGKKSKTENDRKMKNEESKDESHLSEYIDSLAIFCGIKIMYVLFKDLNDSMRILRECKVSISLYVKSGVYMHGLFGTENIIEEVFLGDAIEYMIKISVRK